MLVFKTMGIIDMAVEICNAIIEETATGEDIENLIEDRMYDGEQVIEWIANLNVVGLLQSPIMDNIISQYWEGPYEKDYYWE